MVLSLQKSISLTTILFGTVLGTLLSNNNANASEYITLQYGMLGETIPIEELNELSETGKASGALKEVLDIAHEDQTEAQKILNEEIEINVATLYKLLNSKPGEFVLSELAKVIHVDGYVAGVPALRAAFVNSAASDNRLSLLEVFQNYPTETMYVNVAQLVKDLKTFNGLFSEVKNVVDNFHCSCAVSEEITNYPQLAANSENTQNCPALKVAATSQ